MKSSHNQHQKITISTFSTKKKKKKKSIKIFYALSPPPKQQFQHFQIPILNSINNSISFIYPQSNLFDVMNNLTKSIPSAQPPSNTKTKELFSIPLHPISFSKPGSTPLYRMEFALFYPINSFPALELKQ
jgi:hypothetical protein